MVSRPFVLSSDANALAERDLPKREGLDYRSSILALRLFILKKACQVTSPLLEHMILSTRLDAKTKRRIWMKKSLTNFHRWLPTSSCYLCGRTIPGRSDKETLSLPCRVLRWYLNLPPSSQSFTNGDV